MIDISVLNEVRACADALSKEYKPELIARLYEAINKAERIICKNEDDMK